MAGRPRSPELDAVLTQATAQLLAEVGYAGTTVDTIAARSGVPKSALYRRWRSKAELVFAAVIHPAGVTVTDTGALRTDLIELSERVVTALGSLPARSALPGLLAELMSDPQLRQRFQADVIEPQRQLVRLVLDRAADRGETPRAVDAADVHAQLLGTAYAWLMLIGEPAPDDLHRRLAAAAYTSITGREI